MSRSHLEFHGAIADGHPLSLPRLREVGEELVEHHHGLAQRRLLVLGPHLLVALLTGKLVDLVGELGDGGHLQRVELVHLGRVNGHAHAARLGVHAEGGLEQVVQPLAVECFISQVWWIWIQT